MPGASAGSYSHVSLVHTESPSSEWFRILDLVQELVALCITCIRCLNHVMGSSYSNGCELEAQLDNMISSIW